ncbi:matrix metallo ase-11 [Fusarium heterosporum]|uniref:Matrix metallo ase-11 n=1 Tax=Fusarium heterosporum TaxID=42747 RepID=A0A8H5TEY0_FUSHE|nr:matrix metallo ase-11 [Fusarium heterosporum]
MDFEDLSMKEMLLGSIEEAVGAEYLQTVKPSDVADMQGHTQAPTITEAPICITQRPIPPALQVALSKGGLHDVVIGLEDEVPRWEPGSVVKWSVWKQGFPSDEDANHAASQLSVAAEAWNDADVGVTFENVPEAKDATFVLVYGGENGKKLASAFFPNKKDLDYMFVYSYAYSKEWKSAMWKVFTHELGHVLGLRHEFAISDAQGEGPDAIRITAPDELSVMNYRKEPPEIQQSDIVSLRKFYSMTADASGQPPKIGMTNIVDYIPR